MQAPTEIERLAAARPSFLTDTELLLSRATEHQILAAVLDMPRPMAGTADSRTRAARTRQPPAGGPPGAKRPRVSRTGLVTAGAAVLAAALTAGTLTLLAAGGGGATAGIAARQHATPQTVAYRTSKALTSAAAADVVYSDVTFAKGTVSDGITTVKVWVQGAQERDEAFSAAGSLVLDSSVLLSKGVRRYTAVDYANRTWETASIRTRGVPAPLRATLPARMLPGLPIGPALGQSLGYLSKVALNGREALKLTRTWPVLLPRVPILLAPFGQAKALPGVQAFLPMRISLWIDAATYLPLRAKVSGAAGQVLVSETIKVLPPTKANLANLAPAPVPTGFRQIRAALGP
ncbi:MAG TPA: hypothetical protein VGI58_17930 [Streptosporangiaceae bacterium]